MHETQCSVRLHRFNQMIGSFEICSEFITNHFWQLNFHGLSPVSPSNNNYMSINFVNNGKSYESVTSPNF